MAAQLGDAAKPADEPSPEAASQMAGLAQPSTPGLGFPARPSGKLTTRIVVATAESTARAAAVKAPVQPSAPAKSQTAAWAPRRIPRAPAIPRSAPPAPPASAQKPSNPLARAFSDLLGSLAAPRESAQQRVEPAAARTSSGWVVQLAAEGSENQAKSDAARLSARYASSLNGAAIGVQQAELNGGTVYRLRVFGLSKAGAAALCARVRGDGGGCYMGT